MNSTVKTILIWALIILAAVGLYNFVESKNSAATHKFNLTELLSKVKAEPTEVAGVTIEGTRVTGKLTNGVGRSVPFLTTRSCPV